MAGLPGVVIQRKVGGLGRKKPSEDMISGLVLNGVAVSGGAQLDTIYELRGVSDALAIGLDADYDTNNTVLVYEHIKEFFRLCPSATLYIMLVSQSVSLTDMCDNTKSYLYKLLTDSNKVKGQIRQAAVALNPATYTPTTTGGLDNDVIAYSGSAFSGAVVKAQALAEELETNHMPVHILVEGKSFTGTTAAALDLRTGTFPFVSVTVLQDYDVASKNTLFNKYAAVGTVLGMEARRKVNGSIGYVGGESETEGGNIQSQADGILVNPALSSHLKLGSYNVTDLNTLHDKGYITPRTFVGRAGVYLNFGHTCVAIDNDLATIENVRVIQKAERIAYKSLLPYVNSSQKVDPQTGRLQLSVCNFFEEEVKSAVTKQMLHTDEISGVDAFCDPEQNILSTSEVVVVVEIIPTGTAQTIRIPIGFKNPFNA